jgi:hypothetical protein
MGGSDSRIQGRYSVSPSERLIVNARASRGTLGSNGLGIVFLLLAAITIDTPLMALANAVLSLASFSGYWIAPVAWWARRRNVWLYDSNMEFTADAESLSFRSVGGFSAFDWRLVRGFKEWPDAFLVKLRTQGALYIPKRAINADQVDALRRLLVSKSSEPDDSNPSAL